MGEINYLMLGPAAERKKGFLPRAAKPQIERFFWQENVVCLYLIPAVWAGGRKLTDFVRSLGGETQELWIAPELEPYFPGWKQPFPEPELAAFILQRQPFRDNLVVLSQRTQKREEDGDGAYRRTGWWQERFLEMVFTDLNRLYLVGNGWGSGTETFLDWIYEESGLAACVTDRIPDTDGRRTAVVDLCADSRIPAKKMAAGSLYLDLTSCPEKRRVMRQKRADISYISARNYLDTAFKARYNVM